MSKATCSGAATTCGHSMLDCPLGRTEILHGCANCPMQAVTEMMRAHHPYGVEVVFHALNQYLTNQEPASLPKEDVVAMQFIREREDDRRRARHRNRQLRG